MGFKTMASDVFFKPQASEMSNIAGRQSRSLEDFQVACGIADTLHWNPNHLFTGIHTFTTRTTFFHRQTSEVAVPKPSNPDYHSKRFRRDFGSRNPPRLENSIPPTNSDFWSHFNDLQPENQFLFVDDDGFRSLQVISAIYLIVIHSPSRDRLSRPAFGVG